MNAVASTLIDRPAWVELTSPDAAASRDFYSRLLGWQVEVSPDPQYGGYGIARVDGEDVAGIGPKQSPDAPTAWGLYIGTNDVDALAGKVTDAGGTVAAPPFEVGDQGRMAVFQDPTGAFFSAWQSRSMRGFATQAPNTFGWAELNARGVERAIPFYTGVFGWSHKFSPASEGSPEYNEFQIDGESVAGAWEIAPGVPAEVPSYWAIYFNVDDVDAAFQRAIDLGATEVVAPQDIPGGRFAILNDPQGAAFGLIRVEAPPA
jgi:predicted enzyme related to lactoylglutathione lyase